MKWTKRTNYWGIPYWTTDLGHMVVRDAHLNGWILFRPDGAWSRHWFAWTARLAARRHADQRT